METSLRNFIHVANIYSAPLYTRHYFKVLEQEHLTLGARSQELKDVCLSGAYLLDSVCICIYLIKYRGCFCWYVLRVIEHLYIS